MATAKAVTAGNSIVAGILTTLLNDIKAEFKRRDNPYNNTGLGTIADSLALSKTDSVGSSITAAQFNSAVDTLYKIVASAKTMPS